MEAAFYVASAVAILATIMAITRLQAMHALLYLIVSLLAVAVVFYTLGAPFIAALEVITYAGAIMVLFIFIVMLLNLGPVTVAQERELMRGRVWLGPVLLTGALLVEFVYAIWQARATAPPAAWISPKQVGIVLYGPYLIGVEMASLLLMGAVIGAYHLGRRWRTVSEETYGRRADRTRADARGDLVRAGADGPAGAP